MREVSAHIDDLQHVHEELRQLIGLRRHRVDLLDQAR
jgi:hypothetical protein